MSLNLALSELTYLPEAIQGHDARKGEGANVFMIPPEARSDATRRQLALPQDPTSDELKAWAEGRIKKEGLQRLLDHARNEASKLEDKRHGIAMRVIRVLEAHILDGLGKPSDTAGAHHEVFGFDLAPVDHTAALTAHRNTLREIEGINDGNDGDEPLYKTALRFQNKLPQLQNINEIKQSVEETLERCKSAGINLIESMEFLPKKTRELIKKIQNICHEVRENVSYAGKASMENDRVSIIIRAVKDQTSLQLTVIHEFTHALQMLLRQLGFEEGSLHFEDLLSVAGSGSVTLDEGLADLHSHNTLQSYSQNEPLVKTHEGAVQHWLDSFLRRAILRVNIAFAIEQGKDDAAIRELITAHEFSPPAADFYLGMAKEGTRTSNGLHGSSYYYGGQLFKKRAERDLQSTVREFLHVGEPEDYLSLASK